MSRYLTGTDVLCVEYPSTSYTVRGVPSVCGLVLGGTQPVRGVLAGVIEVVGSLFLPTPLRVVVGSIGVLRIGYGLLHREEP